MSYNRAHIFYSGLVQGVGFRYTAKSLASKVGVKGWVKNLEDGRVEVVLEGRDDNLKTFLDEVDKSFVGHYVKNRQVNWEEPNKEFDGFDIRF